MAGSPPMELRGKIALVTGGAIRIGREIALALAEKGMKVATHYNHSEGAAKELGLPTFRADLSSAEEIETLVTSVEKKLGPISVLINNAAIYERQTFLETTEADWDKHLSINLKAPFLLSQQVAKQMMTTGEGRIINIADSAWQRPNPNYTPYYVAKAGLITLTQCLAKALAPTVRVNAIALGPTLPSAQHATEHHEAQVTTLLKKWGDPKEVAKAVCFLLESADFATGSVLTLDGGKNLV